LPQAQVLPGLLSLPAFVVRYTGRSAVIGQAIHEVDPRMPQPRYETVDQLVSGSVEFERLIAMLMGLFAALALIVTCVGIYSVSSYAVASKTRDIGVRMALGAPTGRVVSGVLRDGMLPVVVGLAVGLVAAYMLVHLLTSLMYGVTPHDPATLAIVTVVLTVAALLGNWLPARRAARIDPLITLRGE
jgi:putative ABC transport system permease protein